VKRRGKIGKLFREKARLIKERCGGKEEGLVVYGTKSGRPTERSPRGRI